MLFSAPMRIPIAVVLMLISLPSAAQSDSLFTRKGEVIVGELKDMVRGVATIETDYSNVDFKIDQGEVRIAHHQFLPGANRAWRSLHRATDQHG